MSEYFALRVENIPGVTDRRLAHRAGLAHRFHRNLEIGRVIQRIENAKNVNPLPGRMLDESRHNVVRVIGITDRVRAAKQHLEANVRNLCAQLAQPQPRVFMQKTHGGVKRRPAPHFEAEQSRRAPRQGVRHRQHVKGAHARRQQRLMGVPERGVRDQQPFLFQRPLGKPFRPQFQQQLPRAGRRCLFVVVSG